MLAAGLATWVGAIQQLCEEREFVAEADETGSGCGPSPIKRDGLTYYPRSQMNPRCSGVVCGHPLECHYTARVCRAPDLIGTFSAFYAWP